MFLAVVEHGGIRAAARAIHLSQAAVTKSMRGLEQQAGQALLVRKASGITMTAAGCRLLERARVISRQVALAQEDLRQFAGDDAGTLRVGVTPFVALTGLGQAFHWFRQRFRRVELQFSEGLAAQAVPRLRDGTLDLAIVAADPGEVHDKAFRVQRLHKIAQRIVVREGHPVLLAPTARALAALEWVSTHPVARDAQPHVAALFARARIKSPPRMLLCEFLGAMTILRHGNAASIFPLPLLGLPETRGIVAVPGRALQPAELELLLVSAADVPMTPAAAYFAHCLAEECKAPQKATSGPAPRRLR